MTGRPPKDPQDRRGIRFSVWLTPAEHSRLQAEARSEGIDMSQLVRERIFRGRKVEG